MGRWGNTFRNLHNRTGVRGGFFSAVRDSDYRPQKWNILDKARNQLQEKRTGALEGSGAVLLKLGDLDGGIQPWRRDDQVWGNKLGPTTFPRQNARQNEGDKYKQQVAIARAVTMGSRSKCLETGLGERGSDKLQRSASWAYFFNILARLCKTWPHVPAAAAQRVQTSAHVCFALALLHGALHAAATFSIGIVYLLTSRRLNNALWDKHPNSSRLAGID
ncbi:hypothetical protein BKA66DRAFT_548736 [Pyrenochaeta sp. MPI-SDFR-AT-0127]|nr:hypothetical protein BKA66DRAFT_548736 [Pyrenochaeta sp. MPI-SDFR-AT-0127]